MSNKVDPADFKTYHGGCHCGAFKFAIRIPEMKYVMACNCSICIKVCGISVVIVEDSVISIPLTAFGTEWDPGEYMVQGRGSGRIYSRERRYRCVEKVFI